MAATVLDAPVVKLHDKVAQITISIPTTVDGAAGATANFSIPGGALGIVWSAISSNFNGKTVELKASNDGTNFFSLAAANQITSSGNKPVPAIECAYPHWQVSITGAPSAAMVATVTAVLS